MSDDATQPEAESGVWPRRGTELTSQAPASPCKPHTWLSGVSSGQRVDHIEDTASASSGRLVWRGSLGGCPEGSLCHCAADLLACLLGKTSDFPAPSKAARPAAGEPLTLCHVTEHDSVQARGTRTSSRATRLRTALMSLRGSLAAIFSALQSSSWLQAGPIRSTAGGGTAKQVRLNVRAFDSQFSCQFVRWQSSIAVSFPDMSCSFSFGCHGGACLTSCVRSTPIFRIPVLR